jgi:hypothetical protein
VQSTLLGTRKRSTEPYKEDPLDKPPVMAVLSGSKFDAFQAQDGSMRIQIKRAIDAVRDCASYRVMARQPKRAYARRQTDTIRRQQAAMKSPRFTQSFR